MNQRVIETRWLLLRQVGTGFEGKNTPTSLRDSLVVIRVGGVGYEGEKAWTRWWW